MRFLNIIAALAAFATAAPTAEVATTPEGAVELVKLAKRQGITEDELRNDACRSYIFIFARGSTEAGNFVRLPPSPPRHAQTSEYLF